MSAFDECRGIEKQSLDILRPFIQQHAFNGQYVVTYKGPMAKELQRTAGDVLYNSDPETVYTLEIKAEKSNRHGNFFLETWSNRKRFTPGWMLTLNTDLLFYHFIEQDEVYKIPFQKLREWAFHDGNIYKYPERAQSKYTQMNDTWGRCVPIVTLSVQLNLPAPFKPKSKVSVAA